MARRCWDKVNKCPKGTVYIPLGFKASKGNPNSMCPTKAQCVGIKKIVEDGTIDYLIANWDLIPLSSAAAA